MRHRRKLGRASSLFVAVFAAGCATLPPTLTDPAGDPLEPLNRSMLEVNLALDHTIIEPVARAYREVVPEPVRDRIRNVIDNLAEPRIFVNDILQGRFQAAGITTGRFALNSVFGLAGMFDVATPYGLPRQSGDFGETLAVWGAGDGPYLVLPVFGPSNVRDAFGLGVDLYTTPPAHMLSGHAGVALNYSVGAVDGVDLRARNIETLEEIKRAALDLYVSLRSLTRQRRAAELREARGVDPTPDELADPEAPDRAPARP